MKVEWLADPMNGRKIVRLSACGETAEMWVPMGLPKVVDRNSPLPTSDDNETLGPRNAIALLEGLVLRIKESEKEP